jgi:uncharacterized protein YbaR (Trm112 family)
VIRRDEKYMIDEYLLSVLRCPTCGAQKPLTLIENYLVCYECNRAYLIVDGIPHMLKEEAVQLDQLDINKAEKQKEGNV